MRPYRSQFRALLTILILSGFLQLCLIIPNPNQYVIALGTLVSCLCFDYSLERLFFIMYYKLPLLS